MRQAQGNLWGDAADYSRTSAVIYMVNPLTFEAVRDRVSGIRYSALGGAFWNLYELKITE
jgi:hypothetical protein